MYARLLLNTVRCRYLRWYVLCGVMACVLCGCAFFESKEVPVQADIVAAVVAVDILPAEAKLQHDHAIALIDADQLEQAAQELKTLSEVYPTYATPVINLGILQLRAKHYTEAEQFFKAALERDAQSAVASQYLGMAYRYLGQFKEAEAAYKNALGIDDTYALAHFNLGVLYDLYLQQPDKALVEFERYVELAVTPAPQVAAWIRELQRRVGTKKPQQDLPQTDENNAS